MTANGEKKCDIFKTLRIIGYVMVGMYLALHFLIFINIIQIQRVWVLLIIGYVLIVIELVPAVINFIRLQNKSITSTFVWLLIVFFLGIAVTVGYIMWTNPMHWENYNPDFGGLIGGLIAGVATLTVVLFSLNIDRRRAVQKARNCAGILREILHLTWNQISRIQNGSKETILYPLNWLEYYNDIITISEYNYLETLLKEFNYVERINIKIKENDFQSAKNIIEERVNYYKYSIADWNIYDVASNLTHIKYGDKESLPWSRNKNNKKIIEDIKRQMYKPVEKYIYDYLNKNGNIDLSDIEADLVALIMKTMGLKDMFAERLAAAALLEICCDFKECSSLINFVWNGLSIKPPNETSD